MAMELLADLSPRYQRLVASIVDTADAAFVVSLDCQFLAWGWRAQQLFGYAAQEVLGRYCYDVLNTREPSGESLCTVNCPMVTAARFGYCMPPFDTRVATKASGAIWVRACPVVMRSPTGPEGVVLVLAADVTQYKLAEQVRRTLASLLVDSEKDAPTATRQDVISLLRICFPDLTQREADVLWQAVTGEDYHDIARALNIQPTTARNHVQHILAKFGVHSQREALLKTMVALFTLPYSGETGKSGAPPPVET